MQPSTARRAIAARRRLWFSPVWLTLNAAARVSFAHPWRPRLPWPVWVAWVAAAVLWGPPAAAGDWPSFRGPNHNGVSEESGWVADWPAGGPPVAWRASVGTGASGIVVAGGRAVTMGYRNDSDVVSCFEAASGRLLWAFTYPARLARRSFEGGPAATPTIDGDRVYTLGHEGELYCLTLDGGRPLWKRDLVRDFGGEPPNWKYAGSPLVAGDLLIVNCGGDGNSTLALDKMSGRKVWGAGDDKPGYATPVPFEHGGRRGVLVFKARAMVAHDLESGRELWRIAWRTSFDVNASSPSVAGERIVISSGYPDGRTAGFELVRGRPPERGPRRLWTHEGLKTKMSSVVVHGGHVFGISQARRGRLMCIDLDSGRTRWIEPGFRPFGTLMVADGKLVILDEGGELVIADAAGDGYREIARAKVLEPRCWVMPVLAGGRLYAKNNDGEMVCLDLRPERFGE